MDFKQARKKVFSKLEKIVLDKPAEMVVKKAIGRMYSKYYKKNAKHDLKLLSQGKYHTDKLEAVDEALDYTSKFDEESRELARSFKIINKMMYGLAKDICEKVNMHRAYNILYNEGFEKFKEYAENNWTNIHLKNLVDAGKIEIKYNTLAKTIIFKKSAEKLNSIQF